MKSKDYTDDCFCNHCENDTLHVFHDGGHERDSSGDWSVCLTCGLRSSGYSYSTHHIDAEHLEILRKQYSKELSKFETLNKEV